MTERLDDALEKRAAAIRSKGLRDAEERVERNDRVRAALGLTLPELYVVRHAAAQYGLGMEEAVERMREQAQMRTPERVERCSRCGGVGWRRGASLPDEAGAPERCSDCNPPSPFRPVGEFGMTFDAWQAQGNAKRRALLAAVRLWAEDDASVPWLVLLGPVGVGKTHLMTAAVNARRARREWGELWRAEGLLQSIRDTFGEAQRYGAGYVLGGFESMAVLAIDEYGKQSRSEWATEQLENILSARYAMRRRTILASNVKMELWPASVGSRAGDLDVSMVLDFSGLPDFRRRGESA